MRFKVHKVEQITATLENRPGILADLCADLADKRVNIRAMTTPDATESGRVRLVVDETELAKKVLTDAGVAVSSTWCLALEMPNHPGSFERLARVLSLAGINIDYIYASSLADADCALGILGVSDLDKALGLDWEAR